MKALRVFFMGGLISYRALFGFLSLWIFVPTLILTPIFQILLFAYIGRVAGARSAEFYVVGNAIQYASVPCLFAMTQTIAEERFWQTLGPILISPVGRLPLFIGRAVPVILNGAFVAAFSLFAGGLILGVSLDGGEWARLVPVPLTHAIEAARAVAGGRSLASVRGLLGREVIVGAAYGVAGYGLIRFLELQSRRHATLERA